MSLAAYGISASSFENIPPELSDRLYQIGRIKNYKRRDYIFGQNSPADRVYVILSGWVKLFQLTEDGQEIVLDMLTSGDVFGASCVFGRKTRFKTAESFTDISLLEIKATDLRNHFQSDAALSDWFMSIMADEIHNLLVKSGHMTSMSAPQRLSCLLLRISSHMVGKGASFPFPYSKSLAASQLGVNPATFSRILARLQEIGVFKRGTEIQIESFRRLSASCCYQCPLSSKQCAGRRCDNDD